MKLVCLVLVLLLSLHLGSSLKFHKEWTVWKEDHGKKYSCDKEEIQKHSVWLANRKFIEEHNKKGDEKGFTLKMNHFGDMTHEEFLSQYNCYTMVEAIRNMTNLKSAIFEPPLPPTLPESVDWRTKGAVTKIKDQGKCASCYAFSAAGALEGAHALAHDKLVDISEQNMIDCSIPYGNHGCNGGSILQVYQYVIDNDGIDSDISYPYTGKQGQCSFNRNGIVTRQTGIVQIKPGKEKELQAAVATGGPVAVAIDGSSNAFRFYEKGVFDEPNCSTSSLTHSALIIGYGVEESNDKAYWLVKNSWGPNWGSEGYVKMARDKSNQCGIATDASFPTL